MRAIFSSDWLQFMHTAPFERFFTIPGEEPAMRAITTGE